MIEPGEFVEKLDELGVRMFTGVPDSLLKELGRHIMAKLPTDRHVITANEGAAVALAIGHFLRSGSPAVVYMQNSGFGNSVNPLLSLADSEVYGIPMLLIVGWRGQPDVKDEPQHLKQGRVMTSMIDGMDLPWAILPAEPMEWGNVVDSALEVAVERSTPFVLLVEKDTFSKASVSDEPTATELASRETGLAALLGTLGSGQIIVSTTGMLSRELFELRAASGSEGDLDFLTVGGMGHASSIALGVDLQEEHREVWCLDGDGALLMHMGSLAVIAERSSDRFFHVVFNNGVHDSVGGQPTAIDMIDLPAMAKAVGYRWSGSTSNLGELDQLVHEMRSVGGPALLEIAIRPGARSDLGRPTRSPRDSRTAFTEAVRSTA